MKSFLEQLVFHKNENLIVNIINIRSLPGTDLPEKVIDFRNDPIFLELPTFPQKNIKDFDNSISSGDTMKKSLEILGFSMKFNEEFINKIMKMLENNIQIPNVYIFALFYQIFAFLLKCPSEEDNIIFRNCFKILNSSFHSPLNTYCVEVYILLVKHIIENDYVTWDIKLLNLVLEQIVVNPHLILKIERIFLQLFAKMIALHNNHLINSFLSVFVMLFENNSQFFQNISYIVSLVSELINDLDPNALAVLAYCSQLDEENSLIYDAYKAIPDMIYSQISKNPVFYDPEKLFLKVTTNVETSSNENEEINYDKLLQNENDDIADLYASYIHKFIVSCNSFLTISSKNYLSAFIESVVHVQENVNCSSHSIDFTILVISFLKVLYKKTSISPLITAIINSKIFDPNYSVFSPNFQPTVSIIRNAIFRVISDLNSNFFYDFLTQSSNPLLLSEHIMRLSYKYDKHFFANLNIMELFLDSINSLQLESNKPANHIILSFVISLLDDYDFSFKCFSNKQFCSSFFKLFSDESKTEIGINLFVKCVSKFQTLPEETIKFISHLLELCTNTENNDNTVKKMGFNENVLAINISHQHMIKVAKSLIKAIISAISHKISLGVMVSLIFDSTLRFLKTIYDDPETLEMTMSICALMTTSNCSININAERFNSILDTISTFEKEEPSDATLQAFLNQMNASTNTALDQMFLIQNSNVIPILLCAFARSLRFPMIIDFFQQLCLYSDKNITKCHNGDLSLLLLKALVGPFEYKGRILNFSISKYNNSDENISEIAEINSVFKLISTIVAYHSTVEIDYLYTKLIFPDQQSGNFMPIANKAMMELYNLFTQSHDDKSIQICSEFPIFSINNFQGDRLSEGFAFSFQTKIDFTNLTNDLYIFLQIKGSNNNIFEIYQQQETIMVRYDSLDFHYVVNLSQSIPLPSNKWALITIFLLNEDERTILYFKVGNSISDDFLFKTINFDNNATVSLGFTRHFTVNPEEISPVLLNNFALFLPPYQDEWFDIISSNGFIELNRFSNIAFSRFSQNIQVHKNSMHETLSIATLMPLHTKLTDFMCLFQCIDKKLTDKENDANANDNKNHLLFAELALRCSFLFTSCMSKPISGISLLNTQNKSMEFDEISKFTNISKSYFESITQMADSYFPIHMNDISIFFSAIFNSKLRSKNFVFSLALELVENSSYDSENIIEILEEIILNIWFWCDIEDKNNLTKNLRHLINFLSQYTFPFVKYSSKIGSEFNSQSNLSQDMHFHEITNLFIEFFIQTHLLCNFSTSNYEVLDYYRFRILKFLPISQNGIEVIVATILDLHSDIKKQLQKDPDLKIENFKNSFQISNYLTFLTNIAEQNKIKFSKNVLKALTDIIDISPMNIVEQLITLLKVSAGENLHMCFSNISLKTNQKNILELISSNSFFDIACIQSIKFGDISILIDYCNKHKHLQIYNFDMWWFWILLVSAITKREEAIMIIISNLVKLDPSQFLSLYSQFLAGFSILKATKAFPGINSLLRFFITNVLEYIVINITNPKKTNNPFFNNLLINSNNSITKKTQIFFAYFSFFSIFYKLKNTCHSRSLINLFNQSFPSDIFPENNLNIEHTNEKVKNTCVINDGSQIQLTNLLSIFLGFVDDFYKLEFNFNFSLSKKNGFDLTIIKYIKVILENTPTDIDGCPNNKYVIMLLNQIIENKKISLNLAEKIFPKISRPIVSTIYDRMNHQVENCLSSISSFLNKNFKHNFKFSEFLNPYINLEIFRFNKFVNLSNRFSISISGKNHTDMPISRYLRFPLYSYLNKTFSQSPSQDNTLINFKEKIFSCKIITVDGPILATFIVLNNEFRIIRHGYSIFRLPYNEIKLITTFRKGCIEIYVSGFYSYLLSLNQQDIDSIINFQSIKFYPFLVLRDNSDTYKLIIEQFSEMKLSLFDVIVSLNFVSGRSYNDLSFFPIFPKFWDGYFLSTYKEVNNQAYQKYLFSLYDKLLSMKKSSNIAKILNLDEIMQNTPNCLTAHLFCVNSHYLRYFESIDEKEMMIKVYKNKKLLEKKPFKNLVLKWLQIQFSILFVPFKKIKFSEIANLLQSIKDSTVNNSDLILIKKIKPIERCIFFTGYNDSFALLSSNKGSLKLFTLEKNGQKLKKTGALKRKFEFITTHGCNYIFQPLQNFLIIFDKKNCMLYCISKNLDILSIYFPKLLTGINSIDDFLVIVIDKHIIQLIDVKSFPKIYFKTIASEIDEIEYLTTSGNLNVIAYQTNTLKVKIISVSNFVFDLMSLRDITDHYEKHQNHQNLLAYIPEDQKLDQLIITEENGLILCKFRNEIKIYNLNGILAYRCQFHSEFSVYTHCRSCKGIDYIFYINTIGDLCLFEATKPSNRRILLTGLTDIISMSVNKEKAFLILVSKLGKVQLYPINFKILFDLCI